MTVSIGVDIDKSEFEKDLKEIRGELRGLEENTRTVEIDADISDAQAELSALKTELFTLQATDYEVNIGANIDADGIQDALSALEDSEDTNVSVDADVSDAQAELSALKTELQLLAVSDYTVDVDAEVDSDSIQDSLDALGEADLSDIDVDLGDLGDLEDISFSVDVDEDKLDRLFGKFREIPNSREWTTSETHNEYRKTYYQSTLDEDFEPEDKEANVNYTARLTEDIDPENKTAWVNYRARAVDSDVGYSNKRGYVNYYARLRDDIDPEDKEAWVNYKARLDEKSGENLNQELRSLKGELTDSDTELEFSACLTKCDDWDDNEESIFETLDGLTEWTESENEIEVKLAGELGTLNETLDRLEESGLTLDGDGNTREAGGTGETARSSTATDKKIQRGIQKEIQKFITDKKTTYTNIEGSTTNIYGDTEDDSEEDGDGGSSRGSQSGTDDTGSAPPSRGSPSDDDTDRWMSDTRWSSIDNPAITISNEGQLERLEHAAGREFDVDISGEKTFSYSLADITPTKEEIDRELKSMTGRVPEYPERNLYLNEARENAQRQSFTDTVREFDKPYNPNREFDRYSDLSSEDFFSMPDMDADFSKGVENVIDREHIKNPIPGRLVSGWNRVFTGTDLEMPETGFIDSFPGFGGSKDESWFGGRFRLGGDKDGGGGIPFFQKVFENDRNSNLSTIFGNIKDGLAEITGGAMNLKDAVSALVPSMAKWWQLIALLSPMLISLGVNALGVAAAFGAIGAAGAAVLGLGLMGLGSTFASSKKEAKKRVGRLKSDLYSVFRPTAVQFAPFTKQFMGTLPFRVAPIADAMKGLTAFMPAFNRGFDAIVGWVTKFINVVVALEPLLTDLAFTFGKLIGGAAIKFFVWLTKEASRNKDMMIQVAKAIGSVLFIVYKLTTIAAYLVSIFAGFFQILAVLSSFISERWVASLLIGIGIMYLLLTVIGLVTGAFQTLLAVKLGALATSVASFAVSAIGSLMSLASALATVIGLEATMLAMTGVGLAVVAGALALGAGVYSMMKPDKGGGGTGSFKGSLSTGGYSTGSVMAGSGDSFGVGGGSTEYVTNIKIEGDVTKKSLRKIKQVSRNTAKNEDKKFHKRKK